MFRVVANNYKVPRGWHVATKDDVTNNTSDVNKLVSKGQVVRLAEGCMLKGTGGGNEITRYSDENFEEMLIARDSISKVSPFAKKVEPFIPKPEFDTISKHDPIPAGWHWATTREVQENKKRATKYLVKYANAYMCDGSYITGEGFDNNILPYYGNVPNEMIIIMKDIPVEIESQPAAASAVPIRPLHFVISRSRQPIPNGWHVTTVDEVRANFTKVCNLLSTWTIAELADGWKVDGEGYGNKILKLGEDEKLGDILITEGVIEDAKKYEKEREIERLQEEDQRYRDPPPPTEQQGGDLSDLPPPPRYEDVVSFPPQGFLRPEELYPNYTHVEDAQPTLPSAPPIE